MKKLCTHNGPFHADDVLAGAMLRLFYPDAEIIRSRNPKDLEQADIVFDVGGKYDGQKFFDHHQGGQGHQASAGLVWNTIGQGIVQKVLNCNQQEAQAVAERLASQVLAGQDAIDASRIKRVQVEIEGEETAFPGFELADVIAVFTPAPFVDDCSAKEFDIAYEEAVSFCTKILSRAIARFASEVRTPVRVAEAPRHFDGKVAEIGVSCFWEESLCKDIEVLYAIYRSIDGNWMCQCVPVEFGSRVSRKLLPVAWRGKFADSFPVVCGVEDAVFCHTAGFICGAKSKEGALKLAELALQG